MKIKKETLKRLIKEEYEKMAEGGSELRLVDHVTMEMVEDALRGNQDFEISRKFAREIADEHYVSFKEVQDELGVKPRYKVSEFFGFLGY
jgi:hypothetical protein